MHGYRLLIACDTFIWHEGQHSFKKDPEATTRNLVQQSSDALYGILEAHYGSGRVPTAEELWGIDWFRPSRPAFNPAVRFSHILHLPEAAKLSRSVSRIEAAILEELIMSVIS
jgi:hypothetical protein